MSIKEIRTSATILSPFVIDDEGEEKESRIKRVKYHKAKK